MSFTDSSSHANPNAKLLLFRHDIADIKGPDVNRRAMGVVSRTKDRAGGLSFPPWNVLFVAIIFTNVSPAEDQRRPYALRQRGWAFSRHCNGSSRHSSRRTAIFCRRILWRIVLRLGRVVMASTSLCTCHASTSSGAHPVASGTRNAETAPADTSLICRPLSMSASFARSFSLLQPVAGRGSVAGCGGRSGSEVAAACAYLPQLAHAYKREHLDTNCRSTYLNLGSLAPLTHLQ